MDTDDIAFDALAASRELREAGLEDRQAEAIAAAIHRAAAAGREGLATKADLDVLGARVDSGLASMRSDLDSGLASMRSDLDSGLASMRSDLDSGLVSMRAHIDTSISALRADLYRALWIQGAGLVAIMAGLMPIAALLGMFG